ncbi:hypothetical protein GCM10011533_06430 [Streptosporangium jomthongense]|nr:hypothetical protein GCM10011533_06430 [Streptosporangium jomthongense]
MAGRFGGWNHLGTPSKNRYEHIHVRLFPAILGLQHFWTASPNGSAKFAQPLSNTRFYAGSEYQFKNTDGAYHSKEPP